MNDKLLKKTSADVLETVTALTRAVSSLLDIRSIRKSAVNGNAQTIVYGEQPTAAANFRILTDESCRQIAKVLRKEQRIVASDVATLCAKTVDEINTIIFALDDVGEI